jgi:hypothetical protein
MVVRKGNQKNLWVDAEFLAWLKKLKAQKQLNGEEIGNLGELTRRIVSTDAIKEVEKQILSNSGVADIRIKLDKRRLFG